MICKYYNLGEGVIYSFYFPNFNRKPGKIEQKQMLILFEGCSGEVYKNELVLTLFNWGS